MDLGAAVVTRRRRRNILAFAAGVEKAPNFSDPTAEDAPDEFERIVSIIAAQIAGCRSLPRRPNSVGLEPFGDADWGALAAESRENYPDLSDLQFAGVTLKRSRRSASAR